MLSLKNIFALVVLATALGFAGGTPPYYTGAASYAENMMANAGWMARVVTQDTVLGTFNISNPMPLKANNFTSQFDSAANANVWLVESDTGTQKYAVLSDTLMPSTLWMHLGTPVVCLYMAGGPGPGPYANAYWTGSSVRVEWFNTPLFDSVQVWAFPSRYKGTEPFDNFWMDYSVNRGDTVDYILQVYKQGGGIDSVFAQYAGVIPPDTVIFSYSGPLSGQAIITQDTQDLAACAFYAQNPKIMPVVVNDLMFRFQGSGYGPVLLQVRLYIDRPDSGGNYGTLNGGDSLIQGMEPGGLGVNFFGLNMMLPPYSGVHFLVTVSLSNTASNRFDFFVAPNGANYDSPRFTQFVNVGGLSILDPVSAQPRLDVWNDSGRVTLAWANIQGPYDSLVLLRDNGVLRSLLSGARYTDYGANPGAPYDYKLVVCRITVNDTLFNHYTPGMGGPSLNVFTDSGRITIDINNISKPVDSFRLYRDSIIYVGTAPGSFRQLADPGADMGVNHPYRLEVFYTDLTTEMLFGYWNSGSTNPTFSAWWDGGFDCPRVGWNSLPTPLDSMFLYRDGSIFVMRLPNQPSTDQPDTAADSKVTHNYTLVYFHNGGSKPDSLFAHYDAHSGGSGGSGLFCGTRTELRDSLLLLGGVYIMPLDSFPHAFTPIDTNIFVMHDPQVQMGNPALLCVRGGTNTAPDTLVAMSDSSDCFKLMIANGLHKVVFISIQYLRGSTTVTFYANKQNDAVIHLVWGSFPKSTVRFDLYRQSTQIAQLPGTQLSYDDSTDATQSWSYELVAHYDDSTTANFYYTYSPSGQSSPTAYCGPTTGLDSLLKGGSQQLLAFTSSITAFPVTRVGNFFHSPEYSSWSLLMANDGSKVDTFVLLASGSNCSVPAATQDTVAFLRLGDMPRPVMLTGWTYQDSLNKGVYLTLRNLTQGVTSIDVKRNGVQINTLTAGSWYIDFRANIDSVYDYEFFVRFIDNTTGTFNYHYIPTGGNGNGPTAYCGPVSATLDTLLNAPRRLFFSTEPTAFFPMTNVGNFFTDSHYGGWVLLRGMDSASAVDTFVLLGISPMSCDQPALMHDSLIFVRAKEMPRIEFKAWYDIGYGRIHLHWAFMGAGDSLFLFRDGMQFARINVFQQSGDWIDSIGDPATDHDYMAYAYHEGGTRDSMSAHYSRNGGGGGNGGWKPDGAFAAWAKYTRNLMAYTGNSADLNRSGLGVEYAVNTDSVQVDSAAGTVTGPLSLSIFFKGQTDASYRLLKTVTITLIDSLSGKCWFDTTLTAGLYNIMGVMTYRGVMDTSIERFPAGVYFRLTMGQRLTVDLLKLAKNAGFVIGATAVSNVTLDGVEQTVSGGVFTHTQTARTENTQSRIVRYQADTSSMDFLILENSGFDNSATFQPFAGTLDRGAVTLDGWVLAGARGDGIEAWNNGNGSGTPDTSSHRDYVRFNAAAVWTGSLRDSVNLPIDSGYIHFNTGATVGKKVIQMAAYDSLLGVSISGFAGQIFHLNASDRTVTGIKPDDAKANYLTVEEALAAGANRIQLGPDYKGMPFEIKEKNGVSITGQLAGAAKTLIDGSYGPGGVHVALSRNISLRGLEISGGNGGIGINGGENVLVDRCYVHGTYTGVSAFRWGVFENSGPDTVSAALPKEVRNVTVINSILDSCEGYGVILDMPDNCRIVNNTIRRTWLGAYLGQAGGPGGGSTTTVLTATPVVNNIFDQCVLGGVVIGKANVSDNLPVSIKSNLFRACDSGAVVTLLTLEDGGYTVLSRDLPTTNLPAASADPLFAVEAYPYALADNSPARNMGRREAGLTPGTDFLGAPRLVSDSLDIGAREIVAFVPGVNLLSQAAAAGYAKIAFVLVPPDTADTLASTHFEVTRNSAAYLPVRPALLRTEGAARVLELYPLPDGDYGYSLSARFAGPETDTQYIASGSFTVAGAERTLASGTWAMVGYADQSASSPKTAGDLAALNDSALYVWDPDKQSYLDLATVDTLLLERGKAYWNLPDTGLTVAMAADVYNRPDTSGFTLMVKQGWNMVSSPFPFPVTIPRTGSKLHFYNLPDKPLAYTTVSTLQPLQGCWYFSETADTFHLAYAPQMPVKLEKAAAAVLYKGPADWALRVSVKLGAFSDDDNLAGVKAGPRVGYPEPPAPMGGITAYFEGAENGLGKRLMESYQAPGAGTTLWNLVVDPAGKTGEAMVAIEGAANFGPDVYVFAGSPDIGFVDVKKNLVLAFKAAGVKQHVVLVVTDNPDFVNAITHAFALAQNSPNPFNPSTRISLFVPYAWDAKAGLSTGMRRVDLSVYDIKGRKVATLVNGELAGGKRHEVVFGAGSGGKAMASGVYFYRLTADNFTQTRKMLLIR
ncbi:MAG: right-handed parallel beta-helix repeat-containing protein [Fibrobacterota bacterium]